MDRHPAAGTDLAPDLHRCVQQSRDRVPASLDGLTEHDIRRPMTPTATNLLGLVKHLAGVERGYLGDTVGRPSPVRLPWVDDKSIWDSADMWATAEETTGHADIVREMIDGRAGGDHDDIGDAAWWARHRQRVQDAADKHRGPAQSEL